MTGPGRGPAATRPGGPKEGSSSPFASAITGNCRSPSASPTPSRSQGPARAAPQPGAAGVFSRPSPDRRLPRCRWSVNGSAAAPPAALMPPAGPRGNHLPPPLPRPARRRAAPPARRHICRRREKGRHGGAAAYFSVRLPAPAARERSGPARPHLPPAPGGSGGGSESGRRAPASRRAHPGPARAGPGTGTVPTQGGGGSLSPARRSHSRGWVLVWGFFFLNFCSSVRGNAS